jgi:hypothetical protein
MRKGSALMRKTAAYLFESSDPVAQHLERSLAAVRETISVLMVTKSDGTDLHAMLRFDWNM